MKSKTLEYIGSKVFGTVQFDFYECKQCGTRWPVIENMVMCNGDEITECPWCREDSIPWENGRGK